MDGGDGGDDSGGGGGDGDYSDGGGVGGVCVGVGGGVGGIVVELEVYTYYIVVMAVTALLVVYGVCGGGER